MTRKEMDMIIRRYAEVHERYGYWKGRAVSTDQEPEFTELRDCEDETWNECKRARLEVVKMMQEVVPDVEL